MIFRAPLPFREALESAEVRTLLPTDFDTRQLQQLEPELRRRAFFSAKVEDARFLQGAIDGVRTLVAGTSDRATQRLGLRQLVDALGLPQASADDAGTLKDLRSEARLNVILDTNAAQMRGYGQHLQATTPEALEEYPAWELIRARFSAEERDWADRWERAGGKFYGGRMLARKDDPVWDRLGDSSLFADGLDSPYPPYAFGSGMTRVQVHIDEAIAMGLITAGERVAAPQSVAMNAELQASPDIREAWLKDALTESLQGIANFDADGVLRAA